ncbi:MAG: hypothetical protein ACRC4N_12980, partial [Gammaproteobacteria bacterium]
MLSLLNPHSLYMFSMAGVGKDIALEQDKTSYNIIVVHFQYAFCSLLYPEITIKIHHLQVRLMLYAKRPNHHENTHNDVVLHET